MLRKLEGGTRGGVGTIDASSGEICWNAMEGNLILPVL